MSKEIDNQNKAFTLDAPLTSVELTRIVTLSEEAQALLIEGQTLRQYLEQLQAEALFSDATKVLALALPKREAVWWACGCARRSLGPEPPGSVLAALEAAERWIIEPNETHRRLAQTAGEAAELRTPAGCAATAAFFSGGSLAPPDVPAVPPGEHVTAHVVAGAVMLAAVQQEPQQAPDRYLEFLAIGLALADGAERWPELPSAPVTSPKSPTTTPTPSPVPPSSISPRRRWADLE